MKNDELDIGTLKIFRLCHEHLSNAIKNYDDEITRENEMSLFAHMFSKLKLFSINNKDLKLVIDIMMFNIKYETTPYTTERITYLLFTIEQFIQTLTVSDEIYIGLEEKNELL